ncbi:hypothetical protein D910_02503 [Dendroctonus ponderosae]|uniref:Uncharacterized protein n=1 Tax=Dendroctonus ponderosae TaxID=77166 RepID=U4U534_DENPD|nr:hypothetical protein D910_02503 [Dendroctonus ponderosae]
MYPKRLSVATFDKLEALHDRLLTGTMAPGQTPRIQKVAKSKPIFWSRRRQERTCPDSLESSCDFSGNYVVLISLKTNK